MEEGESEGRETLEPDQFMGPKRYRIKLRCLRCRKIYSYVTTRLTDKDPPCPKMECVEALIAEATARAESNMREILESQTPPGVIGQSIQVKAIDTTASIVMEDHKMTDLKDRIRTGEAMAPKLPGKQQQIADGFFGGEAVRAQNHIPKRQMDLIGRRAMAGAFRSMALNVGEVQGPHQGSSPLQRVGVEHFRKKE